MWHSNAGHRIAIRAALLAVSAIALPGQAQAQDPSSIFATLGKFVSGFDAGVVFFAPTGFIYSDVLEERGDVQQVGIAVRNPDLGITVGYDVLTGFQAKEESLDLRGAVAALPTISTFYDMPLRPVANILPSVSLGLGIGLSQLQDARATLPQPDGAAAVRVSANGYHVGPSLALGMSFGDVGFYIENSFRYTRFPSVDWTTDKLIVPPTEWPESMDFWSSTLRIGVGIGAREKDPPPAQPE